MACHSLRNFASVASKAPLWLNGNKSKAVGAGVSEETDGQDTGAEAVAGGVAGVEPVVLTISDNCSFYIGERSDIAKEREVR